MRRPARGRPDFRHLTAPGTATLLASPLRLDAGTAYDNHNDNTTPGKNTMDITTIIIQLIAGAVGGNVGGALFKNLSLGTTGNSIAGIIGGPLGGALLGALGLGGGAAAAGGLGSILSGVGGGGVGGVILMLVVGFIKKSMAK